MSCKFVLNETKTVTKPKTVKRLTPMFKVILHNDDINSMEHVIVSLRTVFKFQLEEAFKIMMEAHEMGCALCKIEPLEHAEHHRDQLQSFSLSSTIEPE